MCRGGFTDRINGAARGARLGHHSTWSACPWLLSRPESFWRHRGHPCMVANPELLGEGTWGPKGEGGIGPMFRLGPNPQENVNFSPTTTCPHTPAPHSALPRPADHQPEAARHAVHGRAVQLLPAAAGEAEGCQNQSEGEHRQAGGGSGRGWAGSPRRLAGPRGRVEAAPCPSAGLGVIFLLSFSRN